MSRWTSSTPNLARGGFLFRLQHYLALEYNYFPIFQWGTILITVLFLGGFAIAYSKIPTDFAPLIAFAIIGFFALMIVQNTRRVLLAITILDVSFQLDKQLFYDPVASGNGSIGGLIIAGTTFAIIGLYALWLSQLLTQRKSVEPANLQYSRIPILYLCATALSIFVAASATLAIFESFLILQMVLLFIYIVGTVRTKEDIYFILTMMILGVTLQSLIMIASRFYGSTYRVATLTARVDSNMRVGGTVGGPNSAAGFLTLQLAPIATFYLVKAQQWQKLAAVVAFTMGVMALIFTESRGGWVGFVISIIIIIMTLFYYGRLSLRFVMVMTIMIIIALLLLGSTVGARLTGDDNNSAEARMPLNMIALRMIGDHPILGVGSNNMSITMSEYISREFSTAWIYAVHNKYLLVWVETGFLGFITFIAFLFSSLHKGWKNWQLQDPFYSLISLGFTAAVMGHMVHMLVDSFKGRPAVQPLWLNLAVITAIYCIQKSRESTTDTKSV